MTVTYLDTSACGKLLSVEEHTDALAAHLNSLDEGSLFASQLLETELRRMAVRHSLPQGDVTETSRVCRSWSPSATPSTALVCSRDRGCAASTRCTWSPPSTWRPTW